MTQQKLFNKNKYVKPKPVLKWAGGKQQMLDVLIPNMPRKFNKYIEPFIGGGALFFAVSPENAVIADSNPELTNLYEVIKNDVDSLIALLKEMKNEEEFFYEVRKLKVESLSNIERAARMVYLNRTCFNGLYRVNKKGEFNTPYGKYKNPKICDEVNLRAVSEVLQRCTIVLGDYKEVLKEYAEPGDFIFLDPPYIPISQYSDFKRYTKEQFSEKDQVELANEVKRLQELGCYVLLTNSNHPLVHELYAEYEITVHETRRNINSKASNRQGQDVVVYAEPVNVPVGLVEDIVPNPEPSNEIIEIMEEVEIADSETPMFTSMKNLDVKAIADDTEYEQMNFEFLGDMGVVEEDEDIEETKFKVVPKTVELPEQTKQFPSTRFMGSKEKLLSHILGVASQFNYETVLDLFSGSGVVSYMFKATGKQVYSNDYMAFSSNITKALVENNHVTLTKEDLEIILDEETPTDKFVSKTFKDLYFDDKDNAFIDIVRANLKRLKDDMKKSLALAALARACLKKRPRGIFTYTGNRYNDGRRDLTLSLREQFLEAVEAINDAVFDNGRENLSCHGDAMITEQQADLVYIDSPYYSPLSDNEYVRRYHFIEGLVRDWKDVEMQWHTKTKKFKSYPTPFSSREGAYDAFDKLFMRHQDSIIIVSYSSNSLPSKDDMVAIMSKYKKNVNVVSINHKYSFGNQRHKVGNNKNTVEEYLFVGY
ncbi:hypothetical protein PMEGAS67_50230 [Priestia megaterium]